MCPSDSDVESRETASSVYFRIKLRITPCADTDCQVLTAGYQEDIRQTIAHRKNSTGYVCRAEVTRDDDDQRLLERPVTSRCICPVFNEHDCIASIESAEADELIVSLSVPDRDELASIVSSLREIGAIPRLLQISNPNVNHDSSENVLELEAVSVTNKQQEAVRAAVESGYYESPRKANLSDLSDQLGISRSAVSQRLTAVESNLIANLYDVDGGPLDNEK